MALVMKAPVSARASIGAASTTALVNRCCEGRAVGRGVERMFGFLLCNREATRTGTGVNSFVGYQGCTAARPAAVKQRRKQRQSKAIQIRIKFLRPSRRGDVS
jgi:hypothetical protein